METSMLTLIHHNVLALIHHNVLERDFKAKN